MAGRPAQTLGITNHTRHNIMSMLCSLYRITPEQILRLTAFPDSVGELLGLTPSAPSKASFLSTLFGKPAKQSPAAERKFEPVTANNTFELDQAWHILHFLFSGSDAEGKWPAAFIISGGEAIGPDHGYGSARLFSPELTREISAFLNCQSHKTLDAAYIASDIEDAEIYWHTASEPAERQQQLAELWRVVSDLQAFFAHTVEMGNATLVAIY